MTHIDMLVRYFRGSIQVAHLGRQLAVVQQLELEVKYSKL